MEMEETVDFKKLDEVEDDQMKETKLSIVDNLKKRDLPEVEETAIPGVEGESLEKFLRFFRSKRGRKEGDHQK